MKKNQTYWIIGAIALIAGSAVFTSKIGLPRGIRNNNPGNIRISANNWQGKIPVSQNTDGEFEQFQDMKYGVRAMIKNLITHINNGYNTPLKLINKWAPSNENDVLNYVFQIVKKTGIAADETITTSPEYLQPIVKAMTFHENGKEVVTDLLFENAWELI